ncbi:MAG TPA: hypothetical protein VJP79_04025 [Nitrososphaera sp.]|nr:hypothetical protein [Nitrososphaera sp.]
MNDYSAAGSEGAQVEGIRALQEENLRLKQKLWRLRLSGTLTIGLVLIGIGGASLVASYLASSVILTLAGLGLVFWGVIMLYISPQRFVPEKVVESMSISMTKSIDKLLVNMNYGGRTIFMHPKHLKGLSQGYVFIPFEAKDQSALPSDEALAEERLVYDNPRGIFMVAPSQGLVKLIESEMDSNMAAADVAYLKESLPKLMVNNLRLLDSMAIEENHGFIRVSMVGEAAARVCMTVTKETKIGEHFGCPLCASLGLIISKATGKPVTIQENKVQEVDSVITTTYRMLEI